MRTFSNTQLLASLGLVVATGACTRVADDSAGRAITTGAVLSNYSSVLEMAKARCERAAECSVIGGAGQYADRMACVDAYQDVGNASFNETTCPDGVDRARLDSCVAILRDMRCDATVRSLRSLAECDRLLCARFEWRDASRHDVR